MAVKEKSGWIYILDSNIEAHRDDDYRIFKIGRARQLTSRVKQLGTLYAYKPTISYAFQVSDYFAAEAELHDLFAGQRLNGEWFRLGYEDLTFISEYADHSGYLETDDGLFIRDFLFPYSEDQAIQQATLELSRNHALATRARYYELEPKLDLPTCLYEAETFYTDPAEEDREDLEDYERYLREREEEKEYEAALRQNQENEREEEREEEYYAA